MSTAPPALPLYGLVLAGGYSRRMGRDKGLIPVNNKPAREHMLELLRPFCDKVWLSLRPDQKASSDSAAHQTGDALNSNEENTLILYDLFPGEGPLGALYSAFQLQGPADWLLMPCDLPNMNAGTIALIAKRWKRLQVQDMPANKPLALLLRHPDRAFAEPLSGIWGAQSKALIVQAFEEGQRAVHPLLQDMIVEEFVPPDLRVLDNQNERP